MGGRVRLAAILALAGAHGSVQRGTLPSLIGRSAVRATCSSAAVALERTPEPLREVIEALFSSERSTRAHDRNFLAKRAAARDYPNEIGNRFTYGEFDLDFFLTLLKLASPQPGETFLDLGSGCGRLVFAAALTGYEWRTSVGIELLDELHKLAEGALGTLEPLAAHADDLALTPCVFYAGDGNEVLPRLVAADATKGAWVVFVYSTCMPSVGPYLCELSESLGLALPVGSRVITTDKMLVSDDEGGRWEFRLLAQLDAPNYNTHSSSGYVFELVAKDGSSSSSGGGGGGRTSWQTPMVSRRALFQSALVAAPLTLARRAGAEERVVAAIAPPVGNDVPRDILFTGRSVGLGLVDVLDKGGSRVAVSRVVPGSEAERKGVRAGVLLKGVGGRELPGAATADDVRKLLAEATRPVAVTFQGALAPDAAVELAAKVKGAETERFKIERTREPAANCGIRSRKGDTVEIHYEARLANAPPGGKLIDSSFERGIGAPFALQLGNGDVPKALELGIFDMCIGEARRIMASPRLAYGMAGNRALGVPGNATVVFDVSMEAINFQSDPATKREDTGMALTPWERNGE